MSLWDKLKGALDKMLGRDVVSKVLSVRPAVSDDMINSIYLWSEMYEGRASWLKEPKPGEPVRVVSLGLPALIASEKARMATMEMESEITPPMIDVEKENPNYEPPSVDEETGMVNMGRESMMITEPEPDGPVERANFLNDSYKKLKKQIRRQVEYGIAKGGLIIKPYVVIYEDGEAPSISTGDSTSSSSNSTTKNESGSANSQTTSTKPDNSQSKPDKSELKTDGKGENISTTGADDKSSNNYDGERLSAEKPLPKYEIEFDFVQADRFYPLSFDNNGKITEAAFIQTKTDNDKVYTRLEHHLLKGRTVTVSNYAFVRTNVDSMLRGIIKNPSDLGKPCKLSEVPEWANLAERVVINNVDKPLYAYFKMPEANTIDPYSPLGVSAYSRVVSLIKDADEQYSRMLWEFEGGELAIDVDRDALKIQEYGNGQNQTRMPVKQERLFRKVDLNSEETYNVFAPELRDDSLSHGLNVILTRIEDVVGFSRGTISEEADVSAKTATELKIEKQRSYAANRDIQMALEDALRDAVYVMDVLCTLYEITPPGEYEISFEWDDSIIVDTEAELQTRMNLVNAGISSKLETRMWYFGETENQAKAALQKIEDEKKTSMETNIQAQAQLGDVAQGKDFSGNNNNPKPDVKDKDVTQHNTPDKKAVAKN